MSSHSCLCGSQQAYDTCCGVFIEHRGYPQTAEQLMRSRYVAYALGHIAYLIETAHPSQQPTLDEASIRRFSAENRWEKLQILATAQGLAQDTTGKVAFKAYYTDAKGYKREHYENSTFQKIAGRWYYESGTYDLPKQVQVNRNEPCLCGSGKKYKKCCGA